MQTYKNYLKSINNSYNYKLRKPVFRSSAIFPFIVNKQLNTSVHFLGYWLIKRNIKQITILISVRDIKGNLIDRKTLEINTVKAYKISLKDLVNFNQSMNNFGSIELEVFSSQDMMYPYPAFVINYEGKETSSVVHTCGRIFNDFDDLKSNFDFDTQESGFDIINKKNYFPFFSFVNGQQEIINQKLKITIINCLGEKKIKKFNFNKIKCYETKIIKLLNNNEKKFLKGKKGTVKIKHNFKNFFPRFLSGNLSLKFNNSLITHSYYDLSDKTDSNQYWRNPNKKLFYDASADVPIFFEDGYYTELAVYPNLNPSEFNLNVEVFNDSGDIKCTVLDLVNINKNFKEPKYINLSEIIKKKILFEKNKKYYCRVFITSRNRYPTRIKFALNICNVQKDSVPSNICFNAQMPEKNFLQKKGTFKWGLIQNKSDSLVTISNIGFLKKNKVANITIKFWKQDNEKFIEKKISIKQNASFWFQLKKNKKIKDFLANKPGWITIQSDNPHINGWYFEMMKNKSVGADHLF